MDTPDLSRLVEALSVMDESWHMLLVADEDHMQELKRTIALALYHGVKAHLGTDEEITCLSATVLLDKEHPLTVSAQWEVLDTEYRIDSEYQVRVTNDSGPEFTYSSGLRSTIDPSSAESALERLDPQSSQGRNLFRALHSSVHAHVPRARFILPHHTLPDSSPPILVWYTPITRDYFLGDEGTISTFTQWQGAVEDQKCVSRLHIWTSNDFSYSHNPQLIGQLHQLAELLHPDYYNPEYRERVVRGYAAMQCALSPSYLTNLVLESLLRAHLSRTDAPVDGHNQLP